MGVGSIVAMHTSHALDVSFERNGDDFDPVPRHGAELPDDERVRALADSLDCFLETDLCAIARVKSTTTEAWRKRGKGPSYVLFGNRVLYPREALKQFLREQQRERGVRAAALL
jgi:hypothetical protein